MTKSVTPPSTAGAAGPLFEAQVGANYLLAMLRGAEPRGLPGFVSDRIKLQRAAEGHPLDDVIIDAHDASGLKAVLEVQVKRSMTFAPSDVEFKAVVRQIAAVLQKPEFTTLRYELAVATEHTKRAVTGAYQEVLSWARKMQSPAEFFDRIKRPGSGNKEMRDFVETLRANLAEAGAANDEATTWTVLRRLQIHVYDFNAPGSACETYARDRAADVLHIEDKAKSGSLWDVLITKASTFAAGGGDFTRESLRGELSEFRFDGDRRYTHIRKAIEEAAQFALVAMADTIDDVVLGRTKRAAMIRAAADVGRYVEVRGEAGVGKSGLLRHLAEEVAREGRILVAAPLRIAKGGWSALKGQLGFEGTARELMSDLAADGGGWLFIDNVDFFADDERATVEDLMRAASHVPGIVVVVSARQSFGVEEPSWLPADAIARLRASEPVDIGELDADEIKELREGAPRLDALLAPDHPAKAVTRNLFRLSRLARAPADEPPPRTEIDLAAMWWRTADGADDATKRERARILRKLGALSLAGDQVFDVSDLNDTAAIDALVRSETLRELRPDQMVFRHDVLREWAIANTLADDVANLENLPLAGAGSPAQVRGLQLAARFQLDKGGDPSAWRALLDAVSGAGRHPSWRRAAILAPSRSEIFEDLMPVIAEPLLANDAALLRETIRLVLAVDVQPLRSLYAVVGLDASKIPEEITVPTGGAWWRLVDWLMQLDEAFPLKALPEIVDLFAGWAKINLVYPDPYTPTIIHKFVEWLIAIDQSREIKGWHERKVAFGGVVKDKELNRLEEEMRLTMALFATRAPDDVKAYLKTLPALERNDAIYEKLFAFDGKFAAAAPEELAAITLDALVKPPEERRPQRERPLDGALKFIDHRFLPESPAQGPFFDLLTEAPAVGLKLIRDLIDAAVAYHVKDTKPAGYNVFIVELPGGPRRFLWHFTYGWARSSRYHSITSALMALEAWAHARIEAGASIESMISEIIGPPETPAAYLLIVIDLLLSHWPDSHAAAVPFVGCPELLATDLGRPVQENFEFPDFFGLKALQKEPVGPKLDELKSRPSRRYSLDALLFYYARNGEFAEDRAAIVARLTNASDRLGPYDAGDSLSQPRLMAVHALNRLDPANYKAVDIARRDGTTVPGLKYAPPQEEADHFAPLQKGAAQRSDDAAFATFINSILDRPERSSAEIAERVLAWVKQERVAAEDEDAAMVVGQALTGAALIAMRDATPAVRAANAAWAEERFAAALKEEPDVARQMREGLQYNPVAMAFAGRVFALKDATPTREDFKRILDMAAGDAAASRGAGAAAEALRALNPLLPRAVMRIAFAACVGVRHDWDTPPEVKAASKADARKQLEQRIEAELGWLFDGGAEPDWPNFPSESIGRRRRHYIRLGPARDEDEAPMPEPARIDTYVNHQSAAVWLRALWRPANDRFWLRDFVSAYMGWTLAANGAGLEEREEVTDPPREWNRIFFVVMAESLKGVDGAAMEAALRPITELPERNFFDVIAELVRALDVMFFNDAGVEPDVALAGRRMLADRLGQLYAWRGLRGTKSDGVEMHLGPAGSVLFFNEHEFGQTPRSYLPAVMVERSLVFLSVLHKLAVAAPSPFVAIITLNYLDVAPRAEQLPLLLAFTDAAIEAYPADRSFWIDHGIGPRVCRWLETLFDARPAAISAERATIDLILAKLVAIGVTEAHALERKFGS
ncbi:hypothetical protein [Terricaulis sp.]|uniref:hypothetical protein n=1 Tax=Terricaulis sp. TaxID=2768686 RepID=UPI003782DEA1